MAKYIYKGPMSGATLKGGVDVILRYGRECDLPEDNGWVKSLVAQKRLVPVSGQAKTARRTAAKADAKPASGQAEKAGAAKTGPDTAKAGEKETK